MIGMIWSNYTTALIASFIIGVLSSYIAFKRGRNPYLWFAVGFIFGLFGIMAIFFAPLAKKKRVAAPRPKPQPYIHGPTDKFWYYVDELRTQQGPVSHHALSKAWKEGKLQPSSLVWHENLENWKPLQEMIRLTPMRGRAPLTKEGR